MEEHKFKSRTRTAKGIVYVVKQINSYDKPSSFYSSPRSYLHPNILEYEAFDDGMTQHSLRYMSGAENAKDFLESALLYMKTLNIEERMHFVNLLWFHQFDPSINKSRWEFYRSKVIHKEGKYVYFNDNDLKTSSADSKRFDKRWEEIPSYANGSYDAVLRLTTKCYHSFFEWAFLSHEISVWMTNNCNQYEKPPDNVYYLENFERFASIVKKYAEARVAIENADVRLERFEIN